MIRFRGYESRESAAKLTNTKIYSDIDQTVENCKLDEGEHFWFEVIGSSVMQDDESLGIVMEIQRLMGVDYLLVKTDKHLTEAGMAKTFMIPYIPRYIIKAETASRKIFTRDAKDILEAS